MRYRSFARFLAEGLEGLVVTGVVLVAWPLAGRWLRNWGSPPAERRRGRPGDRLVSPDHVTHTRAVTIEAPASEIWPWLVQIGLGRAGFYSYELLELLVGVPVKNVESIVPEHQELAVGDEILLHPKAPGVPVAALERGSHICFGVGDEPEQAVEKPDPARSWSLYLEPRSETSTRLLLRSCIEPLRRPSVAKRLAALIDEPVDFIMEQRMLRTLRRLAESRASRAPTGEAAS